MRHGSPLRLAKRLSYLLLSSDHPIRTLEISPWFRVRTIEDVTGIQIFAAVDLND
jgi:hypothetical protein